MPVSTAQANKILEAIVNKTAFGTQTLYIGLSSTTPTNTGTNVTEPSGGAYGRMTSTWNAAASRTITNSAAVTWSTATADWLSAANLTHAVFYDASTGGNFVGFAALTVAKNITTNDTMSIAAGDLTFSIA